MSGGTQFPSPVILPAVQLAGYVVSDVDPATIGNVGPGTLWEQPSPSNPAQAALSVRTRSGAWLAITGGASLSPGLVGDIVAEAIASTAAAGATGRYADAAHRHAMPAAGAPVAEAIGSAQVTGAVGTFADSGHIHAMPGNGAPAASARADTAVTGAAATFANSAHRHAREAISTATPIVESGAGAAGTSPLASNEDHVHPAAASNVGHGCRVTNSTTISLADSTYTALTWDTETFDTDNYHSTVSNQSRLTVPTKGIYLIEANIGYAASVVGTRIEQIRVNGGASPGIAQLVENAGGALQDWFSIAALYLLNAGDFVEAFARQSSGGALNTVATEPMHFAISLFAPVT